MWILFGFLAMALPLVPALCYYKRPLRNAFLWPVGSFLCYAAMCVDEFLTISRRCGSGDFGGIEDTIGAVLMISGGVAVIAIAMSLWCLALYYVQER